MAPNAIAHPEVQLWLGSWWIDRRAHPLPPEKSVGTYRTLREVNSFADRIFYQWLGRPFTPAEDD